MLYDTGYGGRSWQCGTISRCGDDGLVHKLRKIKIKKTTTPETHWRGWNGKTLAYERSHRGTGTGGVQALGFLPRWLDSNSKPKATVKVWRCCIGDKGMSKRAGPHINDGCNLCSNPAFGREVDQCSYQGHRHWLGSGTARPGQTLHVLLASPRMRFSHPWKRWRTP